MIKLLLTNSKSVLTLFFLINYLSKLNAISRRNKHTIELQKEIQTHPKKHPPLATLCIRRWEPRSVESYDTAAA